MDLTFDVLKHEYALGGVKIPGVNELLSQVGLKDDSQYQWKAAEEARVRGKYIHKICESVNKGIPIEVPKEYSPYLLQYEEWLADHGEEVLISEERMFHQHYHYAGTIDIITGRNVVIDIKTGAHQRWHALQLILYGMIVRSWRRVLPELPELYLLYLKPDGYEYKEVSWDDQPVCEAAIRIWKWGEK